MVHDDPVPAPRWAHVLLRVLCLPVLAGMLWMGLSLVASGNDTRTRSRPVPGGVTTTGAVIDVETVEGKNRPTYRAVVEFADQDGRRHTFDVPTGERRPTVGVEAEVSYDPQDPGRASDLTTAPDVWKWPFYTGLLTVGTVVVVLLVVILVWFARARRVRGP